MKPAELNFRQLLDHYGIIIEKDNGLKGSILCQFHEDHKPSCRIDFTRNLYYCFPCSEGGNIVNFVMGKETLDYPEAVKWLGDFFGDKVEVAGVDYHSALKAQAIEISLRPEIDLTHKFVYEQLPYVMAKYPTDELRREQLIEGIYKSLVKQKYEDMDRSKNPDQWYWKDMQVLIEDYLWALECAWKDRMPWEKFENMAIASEETYFDHWDEEIDNLAIEKLLMGEIKRITEKLLNRTYNFLTGESKRMADKAKRMMIDWLGLLKALSLDGRLLPKANFIFETGCQYGGTA
jgi:hypothetical protein